MEITQYFAYTGIKKVDGIGLVTYEYNIYDNNENSLEFRISIPLTRPDYINLIRQISNIKSPVFWETSSIHVKDDTIYSITTSTDEHAKTTMCFSTLSNDGKIIINSQTIVLTDKIRCELIRGLTDYLVANDESDNNKS